MINLYDVGVDYGAGPLLRGVSVTIERGDRWGIIGRNGTGKTTLLNVIAGRPQPTWGQRLDVQRAAVHAAGSAPGLR